MRTGRTVSGLLNWLHETVGVHEYDRLDLMFPIAQRQAIVDRVRSAAPSSLADVPVATISTLDGFRFGMTDGSFSGTEPLMRIYAEAATMAQVQRLIAAGRGMTGV